MHRSFLRTSTLVSCILLCCCSYLVASQQQQQQDEDATSTSVTTSSSCKDRSDFVEIGRISEPVSQLSLGFQECVSIDGTPLSAFTMTRFIWTVEPISNDGSTTSSTETIIYSNKGDIVSPITSGVMTSDDVLKNNTVALQFLPGPNVDATGEVGLLIQIPRDQLVDLEYNFRDTSVILQLNDGFTNLKTIDVESTSTQSSAHINPGEGPTIKAKVTQSQFPLDLSLKGNAMSVQVEASTYETVHIHSRNSFIALKGNILENDQNRFIGGNANVCFKGDCGEGLDVVIKGSIQGKIELSDLNGFEKSEKPETPTMRIAVNDPSGSFTCSDSFFQFFTDGLGPGIQCSSTTDTVSSDPPFPCTMIPTTYLDTLVCPADQGPNSTPEDETCECTVVPPNQNKPAVTNPTASPPSTTLTSMARANNYLSFYQVFLMIGLSFIGVAQYS